MRNVSVSLDSSELEDADGGGGSGGHKVSAQQRGATGGQGSGPMHQN
jgi:hypothetical protein